MADPKKKKNGSKLLSNLTSKKRKKMMAVCGELKKDKRKFAKCQYDNKFIDKKKFLRKIRRTQTGDIAYVPGS